jgi:DNA helicase HerA-like ATPase
MDALLLKLKHRELGSDPPRYQPRDPPRYELLEKKRVIRVGRKIRGGEGAVEIGYISSPFKPYIRKLYLNPERRSLGEGKVTLVVAPKGVGKTNLTRLYTQAFYRTTRKMPIVVFQEKRGDLDFTRKEDPEKLMSMGIEPIKLPEDCQKFLIPGENYRIPLAEIEYSELMEYIGKRIGSSQGDRIIQRVWYDRKGRNRHRTLEELAEACEEVIETMEEREDANISIVRTSINRFLDLIELDRLIESSRELSFREIIDEEKINIVDLSRIGDDEERRFVVSATLRMLERNYHETPCFVALTEAHVYAPVAGNPASAKVINRIVTVLARSYGWNVFLETQSPQNLNPRVVENVDEVFIFGFTSKKKREALIRSLQMKLEDVADLFYYVCKDIGKGEGLYATINDQSTPYFVVTYLSPVG